VFNYYQLMNVAPLPRFRRINKEKVTLRGVNIFDVRKREILRLTSLALRLVRRWRILGLILAVFSVRARRRSSQPLVT
jgi:hypothetical protein